MRPLVPVPNPDSPRNALERDPSWYKTGVFYELHVRAFFDSNADGIGDFPGLTNKLDYIKDLGVTALWLLPFYPSPLRDDGYDIADYYNIHPSYGNLEDFKRFLAEAHQRGLRVITELVMNHTSDQHPWFQRARNAAPGSRAREFYVWSDTPQRYRDARVIFKDIEGSNWTWDHTAHAYYWHRFFSHQPDLNYDNPEVFDEMVRVLEFWLDLGVDGFRLDAVSCLYEREGTSCEGLPETHDALRRLRTHVDGKYGDRVLLAEANQWPEDAAAYFGRGQGDECHMAFHFPLMPRLFMAVRMEDRTPIVDILEQTPAIPETAQWALFLRNHDELTLETVTDEERDYMYRTYAHVHQARLNLGIRRRLAPLLGNDRRRIELLNALLFSLPGTPVLYYGDEIGMGDNIFLGDRNGVRTPMQWSPDKNAGFSRGNPQSLYLPIIYDPEYHYEAINVEAQLGNPHSLLWWMRRLLTLRKKWRALGEGQCEFLHPANRSVLSYILRDDQETLLVVANLSRFAQVVELDLDAFRGVAPVELFSQGAFPVITDKPYLLTLGPHSFYWFSLESQRRAGEGTPSAASARIQTRIWTDVTRGKPRTLLESLLRDYLPSYAGSGRQVRTLQQAAIQDVIPVAAGQEAGELLVILLANGVESAPERYALPLAFAADAEADRLSGESASPVIATLMTERDGSGVLYDALRTGRLEQALLGLVREGRQCHGAQGRLEGWRGPAWRDLFGDAGPSWRPDSGMESRGATGLATETPRMTLPRRLDGSLEVDAELVRHLAGKGFTGMSRLGGGVDYVAENGERATLCLVSGGPPGAKDAWSAALDALGRYYDRVGTFDARTIAPPPVRRDLLGVCCEHTSPAVQQLIGTYLESARLLGQSTAALHAALVSGRETPDFMPEPLTPHYLRSLYQSMRNLLTENLRLLRKRLPTLPSGALTLAEGVLAVEDEILGRYRLLLERRIAGERFRVHGDFHLGQALWDGRAFALIHFQGEAMVSANERRLKASPIRDVASMIRSLDYAASVGLDQHIARGSLPPEKAVAFEPWARFWHYAVSSAFLNAYRAALGPSDLLPAATGDWEVLLQAHLLNRAIHEVGLELSTRPCWLRIPLQAILRLLEKRAESA
ncbi:MAG TPA: maltose alpha-D-glucosyltransferase [Verrucomicrobiota bacterium]|nr:maltose alpha-D-glucosyltransferase [Verrucomicrobiota bacterium]